MLATRICRGQEVRKGPCKGWKRQTRKGSRDTRHDNGSGNTRNGKVSVAVSEQENGGEQGHPKRRMYEKLLSKSATL